MKTITLKLTDAECKLIKNKTPHIKFVERYIRKGCGGVIQILNVNKFREFLNDEINKCFPTDNNGMSEMLSTPNGAFYEGSESQKQDNLKSILSKLDDAVRDVSVTITLKLTKSENDLIHKITDELTQSDNDEEIGIELDSHPKWLSHKVYNVDKFREFLIDQKRYYNSGIDFEIDMVQVELDNLKSILSKLDKAVVLNNLQKQITKVEEIDKDFCDMIAEGCTPDESEGQFYNGVRIDEDTILVLSTYFDSMSNSEDYFHYSISKDKLVPVDAEMDEKYRDLFEDCNMLDYTDCFFIMGVEPIAIGDSDLLYGNEYNDTIVNLDVVQNDEPKSYVGIATNEVTYDMLPKECFIVNIMDHKALDKGELVEIIRVRIGENGFYKGYDGVDSWKALNKLNKDVYGVTDLNVVKVMANQSMHGNYQSEIKYHNEKVNKS